MLVVDNSKEVRNFLKFEPNSYYKFVCLARAKDYVRDSNAHKFFKDKSKEHCVHQWLVQSLEEFDNLLPDMLYYAAIFRCRLYVALDRKSVLKTLLGLRNIVTCQLDIALLGGSVVSAVYINRLVNSVTSVSTSSDSKESKCWMFDVDTKNEDTLRLVQSLCGSSYLCTLTTKSGYHVVARKNFNASSLRLPNNVEVKDNALGLVAMY